MLTNEVNGFLEMRVNVCCVIVLHWNPFVIAAALGLLRVSSGHIQQSCDVKVIKVVLSGGVVGTTKV